jgi:Secretion system C-terminal sorting domain
MKHILLVSLFLLLNMLAFAQALAVRNSSNSQTESVAEPTQLTNDAQINDIQAMARRNDPSHSFAAQKKGTIIVEEQVLFIPPVGTNVGANVGTAVLKCSELNDDMDAISDTKLNAAKDDLTDKQVPTNAQNTEGPLSKIEILNNGLANSHNAAHNQDTDAHIRISPNPINDAAVVEMGNAIHGTFQVFDITGRLLNRGQFEGHQFILERKNLNKGVYILRVLEGKSVVATKKIVVN